MGVCFRKQFLEKVVSYAKDMYSNHVIQSLRWVLLEWKGHCFIAELATPKAAHVMTALESLSLTEE